MKLHSFETFKEVEQKVAHEIATKLTEAIRKNGEARLLVSGGSTPIGMFHLLSLKQIDWTKITIGLVDERFVDSSHDASNEKLIRENLLRNEALHANFIPMIYDTVDEVENLKRANETYEHFKNNITVCLLGMGEDGHTASLFPGDKNSEADLSLSNPCILSTKAPVEPRHRISCSKALLLQSKSIFLMISGSKKKLVLNAAVAKKLPISYFYTTVHEPLQIFYSSKK